jgi:hypothetical protein
LSLYGCLHADVYIVDAMPSLGARKWFDSTTRPYLTSRPHKHDSMRYELPSLHLTTRKTRLRHHHIPHDSQRAMRHVAYECIPLKRARKARITAKDGKKRVSDANNISERLRTSYTTHRQQQAKPTAFKEQGRQGFGEDYIQEITRRLCTNCKDLRTLGAVTSQKTHFSVL